MKVELQRALEAKLLTLADDELVLGHRDSEWTGHAPILEEDIAFANIALDELGHAKLWYEHLESFNGLDPDTMIFLRPASEFRNARMVELPRGDWAFSMMRQYLFDVFENVRAGQLVRSAHRPLREISQKIQREEIYHHRHSSTWVHRLALGTEESHARTQRALDALWVHAFQLFVPVPGEEALVSAGYVPSAEILADEWQEQVVAHLEGSGLVIPPEPSAVAPRSEHTEHLRELVDDLQEVARLDPAAEW